MLTDVETYAVYLTKWQAVNLLALLNRIDSDEDKLLIGQLRELLDILECNRLLPFDVAQSYEDRQ